MVLNYNDWCEKYGYDELNKYLENKSTGHREYDVEEIDWLENEYEYYISKYQCESYDSWKDDNMTVQFSNL